MVRKSGTKRKSAACYLHVAEIESNAWSIESKREVHIQVLEAVEPLVRGGGALCGRISIVVEEEQGLCGVCIPILLRLGWLQVVDRCGCWIIPK